MKEIWRLASFRWYWLGLFLSGIGDQFSWVALSWFILKKTGSPVAMGTVILAYTLPAVFSSLLAGVLLDRFDRRKLIILDNILRGLIFLAIVAVLSADFVPLPLLYVLITLAGILSPISNAGTQALLPRLIGNKELLTKANGLMESQWQLVLLFGPAVAGILVATYGEAKVLIFDAISFFICAFCLGRISMGEKQASAEMAGVRNSQGVQGVLQQTDGHPAEQAVELPQKHKPSISAFLLSLVADLKTGYLYLGKKPLILWLAFFSFLFFMAYGPFEVALPLYAAQKLEGGAVSLGLLWTSFAVGSLVGSMIFSAVTWKIRTGYTLAGIIVLWGATTFPFAFSERLDVAMLALGLGGLSYAPFGVIYRSYLQKQVPDEMLGRVLTSIRTLTGLGVPLGAFVCGLLVPVLGLDGLFLAASVICMLVGVFAFPALKKME